jgi:membrane-bound ClpP family serine protease
MLKLVFPVILQLLGTLVVVAEFFIPSGGLISIVAIGLYGYSLYLVFSTVSVAAGFWFVGADIILIPVLVIIGLRVIARSPASLKTTLTKQEGVTSQSEQLSRFIGKEGLTVSHLHPSGIAVIDGHRADVVSSGEFIDKHTPVSVIAVTANQIVVRKKDPA